MNPSSHLLWYLMHFATAIAIGIGIGPLNERRAVVVCVLIGVLVITARHL